MYISQVLKQGTNPISQFQLFVVWVTLIRKILRQDIFIIKPLADIAAGRIIYYKVDNILRSERTVSYKHLTELERETSAGS